MSNDVANLVDPKELDSFLVPAYGFDGQAPADFRSTAIEGGGCYDRVRLNRTFVPRTGPYSSTSANLIAGGFHMRSPNYTTLRDAATPRPERAYNVCLLADGPRRFYNSQNAKRVGPWWEGLNNGFRDCFAVWRRPNGEQMPSAYRFNDGVGRSIYAARYGHGVLYAATARIDATGHTDGYRIRVLCVKFEILDSVQAKGDILRLMFVHNQHVLCSSAPKLEGYQFESFGDWADHVAEAERGFAKFCTPLPKEVAERQMFLLEQWNFDKLLGAGYRSSVAGMYWQEALKTVDAPWKLAIVASIHGNRAEFSSDGGIYTIHSETVPTMINRHACTDERRDQLMGWVYGYVAPMDRMWSYRGD